MEQKNLQIVPKTTPRYTNQASPTILLQGNNGKCEINEDFQLSPRLLTSQDG